MAVLAKGEGLMTKELLSLLHLGHATLASLLMSLVVHLDVVLRVTLRRVVCKELAVPAVEDVHLRKRQAWIVGHVGIAVVTAHMLRC